MTIIYVDELFFLNAVLDLILFVTVGCLNGQPLRIRRWILCAGLGGIYAVAAQLLPLLASTPGKLLWGAALSYLAFRTQRFPLRQMLLFWLVSVGYAGGVFALLLLCGSGLFPPVGLILLGFALCFVLLGGIFARSAAHGGAEKGLLSVKLTDQGRCVELCALYDSGNTLRQPGSRQPLLVADAQALSSLWEGELASVIKRYDGRNGQELLPLFQAAGYGKKVALREYQTVGQGGTLLLLRIERLQVGSAVQPEPWIALSAQPLSDGGGYCALWGGKEEDHGMAEKDSSAAGTAPAGKADVHWRQRHSAAAAEP